MLDQQSVEIDTPDTQKSPVEIVNDPLEYDRRRVVRRMGDIARKLEFFDTSGLEVVSPDPAPKGAEYIEEALEWELPDPLVRIRRKYGVDSMGQESAEPDVYYYDDRMRKEMVGGGQVTFEAHAYPLQFLPEEGGRPDNVLADTVYVLNTGNFNDLTPHGQEQVANAIKADASGRLQRTVGTVFYANRTGYIGKVLQIPQGMDAGKDTNVNEQKPGKVDEILMIMRQADISLIDATLDAIEETLDMRPIADQTSKVIPSLTVDSSVVNPDFSENSKGS